MPDDSMTLLRINRGTGALAASVHRTESPVAWVVFCHGLTGMRLGPGYLFVKLSRALQARGIASLRFDFSGSGESDGLFCDITVDGMLADLRAVIGWLRDGETVPRLFLLGHSLGGCVAALATAHETINGLVLLAPVADPLGISRRRTALLSAGPNQRGFFENGPHEMARCFLDSLEGVDPVAVVQTHLKGGLLLFQGDADPSVGFDESRRYLDAAGHAGLRTEHCVFRGVDHNFSTVSSTADLCERIPRWIKEMAGS